MQNTRQKLLRTAARLFAKRGYVGTSVRDIVQEAEVNISAIRYYFGDKKQLYFATIEHMLREHTHQQENRGVPMHQLKNLDKMSRKQALALLKVILDVTVDNLLMSGHSPFDRICMYMELDLSEKMRKLLIDYMTPFHELPHKLIAKITGLAPHSTEVVFATHCIFGQMHLSDCQRLVIKSALRVHKITPKMQQKVKQVLWKNTLAILNSYNKGQTKDEKIFLTCATL